MVSPALYALYRRIAPETIGTRLESIPQERWIKAL
jgi:hypothetical protein